MTHTTVETVQPHAALDGRRHYSPDMLTEQPCPICGYRVPLVLDSPTHPCCDPTGPT